MLFSFIINVVLVFYELICLLYQKEKTNFFIDYGGKMLVPIYSNKN